MRTVVCIGGGRFGAMAVHEAAKSGARVLVVDHDERCLARELSPITTKDPNAILNKDEGEVLFLDGDGIPTLMEILEGWVPDVVIPAINGHLAALLAVEHCCRRGRSLMASSDRLSELVRSLPSRSVRLCDARHSVIVTSFMEEGGLCIESCGQPTTCPITGESNPIPMNERILGSLRGMVDDHVVLVTLSVGTVGGISGRELRSLLDQLDRSDVGKTWGIATSCRCHGVINLLRIE
jgi:hypothetical protein